MKRAKRAMQPVMLARGPVTLTFEFDADEFDEVLRIARETGQSVETVGEEAMRIGVRALRADLDARERRAGEGEGEAR
jgi:hypothetical protein